MVSIVTEPSGNHVILKPTTISAYFGELTLRENGISYLYKNDDLVIDETVAIDILRAIQELNGANPVRIIVFQSSPMSYTFEGIETLLAAENFEKTALVCSSSMQQTVGRLIQNMAHAQKIKFDVGVFAFVEEAEAWLGA